MMSSRDVCAVSGRCKYRGPDGNTSVEFNRESHAVCHAPNERYRLSTSNGSDYTNAIRTDAVENKRDVHLITVDHQLSSITHLVFGREHVKIDFNICARDQK